MRKPTGILSVDEVTEAGNGEKRAPERFKFRHVHAITGTFVLLVVGILIAALIFTGRSQRWLIGNVTLRIVLPEDGAAGIRQGSEVYFLGTLMGGVSDVSVDPAGRMYAQVNIRRDFFLFVRADSSAVVKRKFGVVGDAYFEITRGHGQTLPEKDASIVCNEQLPSALESAVEEIRRDAVPALQKLTAGLGTWTGLGSNMVASLERVDRLIARADGIAADLQDEPSAADELKTFLVNANRSMDELQVTLHNLGMVTANLHLASTNLPAISDALGKESKDLPGLVLQSQTSMRELERSVEAMQRHWLLRKYVNKTNPVPVGASAPTPAVEVKGRKVSRSPKGSTP
ncbi:MAG TPA: MlaD family protein [Candidatus Binatia bacterium]|nr:MlaD family protein [Candidatus Binatia bacterium]